MDTSAQKAPTTGLVLLAPKESSWFLGFGKRMSKAKHNVSSLPSPLLPFYQATQSSPPSFPVADLVLCPLLPLWTVTLLLQPLVRLSSSLRNRHLPCTRCELPGWDHWSPESRQHWTCLVACVPSAACQILEGSRSVLMQRESLAVLSWQPYRGQ